MLLDNYYAIVIVLLAQKGALHAWRAANTASLAATLWQAGIQDMPCGGVNASTTPCRMERPKVRPCIVLNTRNVAIYLRKQVDRMRVGPPATRGVCCRRYSSIFLAAVAVSDTE